MQASFFEWGVAFAVVGSREEVDIAVLETGMGGGWTAPTW